VKVRVPGNAALARFFLSPAGRVLVALLAVAGVLGFGVFTYYYSRYSRLIDQKLRAGPFANTAKIFAAPRIVSEGEAMSPGEIAAELRLSGYGESRGNPMGSYRLRPDAIEIFPGPLSYFEQEAAIIKFSGRRISQIVSLDDNTERSQYQLEPRLITNLFDRNREKRRLVHYAEIPQILIQAVTSAEDKRFFQHAGFDPFRVIKAAYIDVKEGSNHQGASTISMQLARSLWLTTERTWRRKLPEVLITLQLEQKLSKNQIFEHYCNQIYLGRRGTFSIHGFGEAAQVYLGKDLRQLTVPEAAMLAGLIQNPGRYNPFRYPERMRDRRNVVLGLMRYNGYISDREYALAIETPLTLAKGAVESQHAPYFVDLVNEFLQSQFRDVDFQTSSHRVYTTLDLDLQRAASEAVRIGVQHVDDLLKKQRRHRNTPFPDAQVALVALDPHTGAIKALVGGRNYGVSQLNHVIARRQPGSVFKPFVFAAAMDTALEGHPRVITASTTVVDEPTTFWYDEKAYEPSNFKKEFHGQVTLRRALAKSMNVATVKVAEMVGYDTVVDLAKRAGMNYKISATPAVALGAYEVTPIEIAGAYTIFANGGEYAKPNFISMVRTQRGKVMYAHEPDKRRVLDHRVAYLMVNLMEEVMRTGTAAGVRARGFTAPAAGKTGTSHDGWFAGFTSELLCIVWVGFDDNRELNLEGAHSALPIWTEFMKRAAQYRPYRNAKPFQAPDGIVSMQIDPLSGMSATPFCPTTKPEVFIAGSEPVGACNLHGGGQPGLTNVAGWEKQPGSTTPAEPQVDNMVASRRRPVVLQPEPEHPAEPQPQEKPQEKKGFFRRLLNVFK